jgi:hypothetical protein
MKSEECKLRDAWYWTHQMQALNKKLVVRSAQGNGEWFRVQIVFILKAQGKDPLGEVVIM